MSKELDEELAMIKRQGYRTSESRQLVGVTDISVPVKDARGNAIAVLTCPYIETINTSPETCPRKSVEETKDMLLELAEKILIE